MKNQPLISIIIPTYNRTTILNKTIKNVLNQTWNNIQIIIVDDGNNNQTFKLIKLLNNNRIKYIRTKNNLGCALARLKGIQNSKGKYITFLDDDDNWTKKYLQNQYKQFLDDDTLDLVMCNYIIKINGKKIVEKNIKKFTDNFQNMIHKSLDKSSEIFIL